MGPTGQAGTRTAPVDGSGHRHQSQSEEEEVLIKIEAAFWAGSAGRGRLFSTMCQSAGNLCAAKRPGKDQSHFRSKTIGTLLGARPRAKTSPAIRHIAKCRNPRENTF